MSKVDRRLALLGLSTLPVASAASGAEPRPAAAQEIATLESLIEALTDPAFPQESDLPHDVVRSWLGKGYVPPSRQVPVICAIKRRGLSLAPELIGCTREQCGLLGV